jgi:hypothetical protein
MLLHVWMLSMRHGGGLWVMALYFVVLDGGCYLHVVWNVCVITVYGLTSRLFPSYFRPYLFVFVYPFILPPVPFPLLPFCYR